MSDLLHLLEKTSRTFALSIPVLPEPTRREVMIAYLLFRLADTLEDAAEWSREQRIRALQRFGALLSEPTGPRVAESARQWSRQVPIDHQGYQELMMEMPYVFDQFRSLGRESRRIICDHTARTVEGMAEFVGRTDASGRLQLRDVSDLKAYCYVVAGIVGEMLTELFILDRPMLDSVGPRLRSRSVSFGEALQLVNILKDSTFDSAEGRSYLPANVGREEILELARGNLDHAAAYVLTLQSANAPTGLVKFTALPVLLARATLDKLEVSGPGSKIGRPRVFALVARLEKDLALGRPALEVV